VSESPPHALSALPLIAHVVYRFDYGGLENGIVNLINATQGQAFRHCVIALTEATDFRKRLRAPDVEVKELGKKPGKDFAAYLRLYRLLRKLRPEILHTRNVGTLDCAVVGRLAGVSVCIHGEHGWDVHDPDGTNPKFRRMRRMANPFVRHFVTVSESLNKWLIDTVGIPSGKVTRICNGVDTDRFCTRGDKPRHEDIAKRFPGGSVVVGSVLRFQEIKDPLNLVEAFVDAHSRLAESGKNLCLVMVGDGALRQDAMDLLEAANLSDVAWLPGSREDIPDIMRALDLFVLGSRREGISNTLLEAMACGLPVIATNTGGNVELVRSEETGTLVAPGEPAALAEEIRRYAQNDGLRESCGESARRVAVDEYSLDTMIDKYQRVYTESITRALRKQARAA